MHVPSSLRTERHETERFFWRLLRWDLLRFPMPDHIGNQDIRLSEDWRRWDGGEKREDTVDWEQRGKREITVNWERSDVTNREKKTHR